MISTVGFDRSLETHENPKKGHAPSNAILLVAFMMTATQGCSFLFVSPPPETYQAMPYFDCTTNVAAPVIDTLLAVGDGIAAGINGSQGVDDAIVTGNVLGAVLFGIAAGYGFVETGKCSKAKSDWAYRNIQTTAPPASPTAQPPPRGGGCERDTDCKGDRICDNGLCMTPPSRAPSIVPVRPRDDSSSPPLDHNMIPGHPTR